MAKATTKATFLIKSEPSVYSFDDLVRDGKTTWDGVRNYEARNNIRAMKKGDLLLYYHSNDGKEVVGICKVITLAHPDPNDGTGTWECVTVKALKPLPKAVTLSEVKANPVLANMSLVKSMRLSVQPVLPDEWTEVCRMGGLVISPAPKAAK